jgi:hypothetical protein
MPRIQITRTVRIALVFLRVYLIALLVLILVKFILLFTSGSSDKAKDPPVKPSTGISRQDPSPGG